MSEITQNKERIRKPDIILTSSTQTKRRLDETLRTKTNKLTNSYNEKTRVTSKYLIEGLI